MKKINTGLFTTRFYFTLNEYDKYTKCKKNNEGYYDEIFIENGYCLEVTKRTIKM